MKKIAVLGPKGTYCDIACKQYLKSNNLDYEIVYYPSILKTAQAVNDEMLAIIPFENTLDGFVIESMDQIILHNYNVLTQVKLHIDFAFVTNAKRIEDVKACYVQFKAYGQCLEFISNNDFNVLKTESNIESLNLLLKSDNTYAAIIPMHILEKNDFNIKISHIADSKANETRFFVITNDNKKNIYKYNDIEASIVVTANVDRSGILYDILKRFHDLDINLKSIMSRPMKTEMGKYRFYMEASLTSETLKKLDALENSFDENKDFSVHILGVYNKL